MLNPDTIEKCLYTKKIARQLIVFKSTSSTNNIAWEYSSNNSNDGLAIFAEHQRCGRGRRGNSWLDSDEKSLLFSILLCQNKIQPELLTLLAGVAVAETLSNFAINHVRLKWPNDIIVNGKKIAGILTEYKKGNIVIGIGVNCHQTTSDFEPEIEKIATSIDIQRNQRCDRNVIAAEILNNIEKWLEIAKNNRDRVLQKWQSYSSLLGTRIGLLYNKEKYYGNCIGIDPEKGLILQLENGGVRMFEANLSSIIKD